MLTNRAFRRRQRGASLVELALVLFILLLILAAIVDFGRVFNHYVVITNASREGARYACGERVDLLELDEEEYKEKIEDAVRGEVSGSSVDPQQLEIEIDPDPVSDGLPSRGEAIAVTVRYEVSTIIADIAGAGFGSLPLRARTEMRVSWPQE